jgi:hypothetical protein
VGATEFYDSRATCGRCGAVHAVFRWVKSRTGMPHPPVRDACTYTCRKCHAVLFEEDERDGDHTMVLLEDHPEVAQIRARERTVVRRVAQRVTNQTSPRMVVALALTLVGAGMVLAEVAPWLGAALLAASGVLTLTMREG